MPIGTILKKIWNMPLNHCSGEAIKQEERYTYEVAWLVSGKNPTTGHLITLKKGFSSVKEAEIWRDGYGEGSLIKKIKDRLYIGICNERS